MSITKQASAELLAATDEEIDDALSYAQPLLLRAIIYQLTGDQELADIKVPPNPPGVFMPPPITDEADVALIRRKAGDFLKSYRDAGAGPIGPGPQDRLPESVNMAFGEEIPPEAMNLWIEELALTPRMFEWRENVDLTRLKDFSVTVIGSGLGGLNVAAQLKMAGIPFSVIEKNSDVGGTWFENRYPGARVDSPSRAYTHTYGVDFPYPYPFCTWDENVKYFNWVADEFDIRKDISFNTEVTKLVWDEDAHTWEVYSRGPDGERISRSNAIITCVGFLNRPNMPQIEGMLDFEGSSFHSARWPEDLDPAGKRVIVIGTGCSGYQMTPELALTSEHLTVFQRTPQWLLPRPGYRSKFPPQVNWLDRNLPYHTNFMRMQAEREINGLHWTSEIDPDFDDPYTCSLPNKLMRDVSMKFLYDKLGDSYPELIPLMTPEHPPWSARPVLVDQEYSVLDAIQRDNVSLVTAGIKRITKSGVVAADGHEYKADIIVYATGFKATEYLYPMEIVGRDGLRINDLWAARGAMAYKGAMIPGLPNFWSLYGPNTSGGLHVATYHELTTIYAIRCIERLLVDGKKAIEVRQEPYEEYNEWVDERNNRKVWSDPRAHNYYWTQFGRSAVMCPFSAEEVYDILKEPTWEDMDER